FPFSNASSATQASACRRAADGQCHWPFLPDRGPPGPPHCWERGTPVPRLCCFSIALAPLEWRAPGEEEELALRPAGRQESTSTPVEPAAGVPYIAAWQTVC